MVVQVVKQAATLHTYAPHDVVPLSMHVPAPSHVSALVWVELVQLCGAHTVPAGAYALVGQIVDTPEQTSATSQNDMAARQTVPMVLNPQVPFVAAPELALQAWQSVVSPPPHAVLQQYPSTQKLLRHSAEAAHNCPFSFLQLPTPSHEFVPEHVPGSSCPMFTFEHTPTFPEMPQDLHAVVHAELQQYPSAQNPLRHSVAAVQTCPVSFLHTPMPSQDWVAPEHTGTPLVSSCPDATLEQVPTAPVMLHDLHVPLHATLQQTPSKHWPLTHSLPVVQDCPLSDLHAPEASQLFGPLHTLAGTLSSPDVSGVQIPTLPMTLQARHAVVHALEQQTPSTQKLLTQSVAAAHACPSSFLHVPAPSHEFVPVHAGPSSLPFDTLTHLPTLPGTLHALQELPHAASQQTPSTQKPLKHSADAAQAAPSVFVHALMPLQTVPPF